MSLEFDDRFSEDSEGEDGDALTGSPSSQERDESPLSDDNDDDEDGLEGFIHNGVEFDEFDEYAVTNRGESDEFDESDGGDDGDVGENAEDAHQSIIRQMQKVEPTNEYRAVIVRKDGDNDYHFLFVNASGVVSVPVDSGNCVYNVAVAKPDIVKYPMNKEKKEKCTQHNLKTFVAGSAVQDDDADDGGGEVEEGGYTDHLKDIIKQRLAHVAELRKELENPDIDPSYQMEITQYIEDLKEEAAYASKQLGQKKKKKTGSGKSAASGSGGEQLEEIYFHGDPGTDKRKVLQDYIKRFVYVEADNAGNLLQYPAQDSGDGFVQQDGTELDRDNFKRRLRSKTPQIDTAWEAARKIAMEKYKTLRFLKEKKTRLTETIRTKPETKEVLSDELANVTRELEARNRMYIPDHLTAGDEVYTTDEKEENFPSYRIKRVFIDNQVELYPITPGQATTNVNELLFRICTEDTVRVAPFLWRDMTFAGYKPLFVQLEKGASELANNTKVLFCEKVAGFTKGVLEKRISGGTNIIYTATDGQNTRRARLLSVPRGYYTPKFKKGAQVVSRKNKDLGIGTIVRFKDGEYKIEFKIGDKTRTRYIAPTEVRAAAGGKPAATRIGEASTANAPKSRSAKAAAGGKPAAARIGEASTANAPKSRSAEPDRFQVGALVVRPTSEWGAARIESRDGDDVWVNFKNENTEAENFHVDDLRIYIAPRGPRGGGGGPENSRRGLPNRLLLLILWPALPLLRAVGTQLRPALPPG